MDQMIMSPKEEATMRRKEDVMKQLSIFDLIPEDLRLGYLDEKDIERHVGEEIPFRELVNYIGRQMIIELPRQGATDYKAVMLLKYLKLSDKVYRWKDGKAVCIGTCDRIGFTDDNRRKKMNSWVSEMYCRNGRYASSGYAVAFHEIREEG